MQPDFYITMDQTSVGMRLIPCSLERRVQICEGSEVFCYRQPAAPAVRLILSELVNPYPNRFYATSIVVTSVARDSNMSNYPVTAELWTGESLLWACHIGKDLLGERLPLVNHRGIAHGRTNTVLPIEHVFFPTSQDCHAIFHVDCLPERLRDAPIDVAFTLFGFQGVPMWHEEPDSGDRP